MRSIKKVLIVAESPKQYADELSYLASFTQTFHRMTPAVFFNRHNIGHYDLMLLDCDHNIARGLESVKKIKEATPQNLVLLVGECDSAENIISAFRYGARDYIRKPVDFDHLRKTVTLLYNAKDASREKRPTVFIDRQDPSSDDAQDTMTSLMSIVIKYIDSNLLSDIYIEELAQIADLSKYHFIRRFRELTGYTPHKYIICKRIEKAKEMMRSHDINISAVSATLGFSYVSDFSHHLKKITGNTPSHYKKIHVTTKFKKS